MTPQSAPPALRAATTPSGDGWTPQYSRWRHGGWYVDNVRYPSGAIGCVSRNYADRKWRIVADARPFADAPTFRTRDAAARAERDLAHAERHPAPWADGHGVWHVRVSARAAWPLGAARHALREAITEREAGADPRVWTLPVRVPELDTPGLTAYREGFREEWENGNATLHRPGGPAERVHVVETTPGAIVYADAAGNEDVVYTDERAGGYSVTMDPPGGAQ